MVKFVGALFERRLTFSLRRFCTKKKEASYTVENLKDRSVILVTGRGASDLLQKLMANDIAKLDGRNTSIFTVFLNDKGKVLHDSIVYKCGDDYLVEVDDRALQPIKIHLKLFKGGRDVEIKNYENSFSVWSVVHHEENDLDKLRDVNMGDEWISCLDPRLEDLGLRIVGPRNGDVLSVLKNLGLSVGRAQRKIHQILRYKLGVAQGLTEIPLGRYDPNEVNADFLSGLCPKKTNYIGCNPRARRLPFNRRVFPLFFQKDIEDVLQINSPIQDHGGRKKSPIGYLCGVKQNVGLGLISVTEALKNTQVRITNKTGNVIAQCNKPSWWPPHHSITSSLTVHNVT